MNRSADRLNLCLSELKGAEQLKNFSPFFFIIIEKFDREMIFFLVRNGNLRKKKERNRALLIGNSNSNFLVD